VDVRQDGKMEPGFNFLSYRGAVSPNIPLIVDNDGEIRWLLNYRAHPQLKTLSYDAGMERLANGNLYFGDGETDTVYEVDLFGNVLHSWPLGGYLFHHNVQEKPDGNFLVTVNKPGSVHINGNPTIEDYVIEIDRQSGAIIREWDLKESLDEYRVALTDNLAKNPIDWIHINAVIYDPSDDTIIVSGRTQGLIKLTNDNKVKWILGPHKGWGVNRRGEDLNAFLLAPLDSRGERIADPLVLSGDLNHADFEWNWYQHAPLIKDDGNIMLFDNGTTRNFNSAAPEPYSRAVEYRIDSEKMTAQQIWTYGKERGIDTYSSVVSDVDFLADRQSVLFIPGYRVVNASGKGGKVVEIDYLTKEIVFQMSVSSRSLWGFHRAERMNIY
jgi:arylsulfate sulfotransferase